ncbi:FkbM family methyltransferase [Streptomyces sp. NPDC051219]|uniref:FkbM family methyltransferase n=1 Tax=Streptomyces sp. NPDC051219 TaxID=3155283 RepID=UPI00344015D5
MPDRVNGVDEATRSERVTDLVRLAKRTGPLFRVASSFASPANRAHPFRAVVRTVSYDVRTRWLGRPTVARLGERSLLVSYRGETNSPHAVYRNPPNWPEMGVWQRLLKPRDLFVDVGANIGAYTILAAECGADVIAVEPNARNADRIREHLRINNYRAEVVEKVLADAPGVFRMTSDLDSLNHLLLGETDEGEKVEATTLDEVVESRDVAGVKIDVEGAERLVLEGATKALNEQRIRVIQLEWSEHRAQHMLGESRGSVADLLRGYGYLLHRPDRRGRMYRIDGEAFCGRDVFAALEDLSGLMVPLPR